MSITGAAHLSSRVHTNPDFVKKYCHKAAVWIARSNLSRQSMKRSLINSTLTSLSLFNNYESCYIFDTIKQEAKTLRNKTKVNFFIDAYYLSETVEESKEHLNEYREKLSSKVLTNVANLLDLNFSSTCGHYSQIRAVGIADVLDGQVRYRHLCLNCAIVEAEQINVDNVDPYDREHLFSRNYAELNPVYNRAMMERFGRNLYNSSTFCLRSNAVDDGYRRFLLRGDPEVNYDQQFDSYYLRSVGLNVQIIKGYHHHKSHDNFQIIKSNWTNINKIFYGIELEVFCPSNEQAKAREWYKAINQIGEQKYAVFESDGSIGNGFEMISMPAGIDIHKQRLERVLMSPEIKAGCKSHDTRTCGLHVHITKSALTQSQISRMQSFLNDIMNQELITQVARRYNTNYSRFVGSFAKLKSEPYISRDRYEVLNLTNERTVEVRIFRGSLKYEAVLAAIEFTNALVNFCRPGITPFNKFNSQGFREFLTSDYIKRDTKILRQYLGMSVEQQNEEQLQVANA